MALADQVLDSRVEKTTYNDNDIYQIGDSEELENTFKKSKKQKGSTLSNAVIAKFIAKTNKESIADNDIFVGGDSASSNNPVTWLWSMIKSTLKTYFDTLYGGTSIKSATSAGYTILDNDKYTDIFCDSTGGDCPIVMPLLANNILRKIRIFHVKGDGSHKVTIAPNGTDANKLTVDGLNSLYLPKIGNYILLQQDSISGYWIVLDEKITSQARFNTHAGYGSTATKIPYFTNQVENIGNMMTVTNDSTNGLQVTINRSGRYSGLYEMASATSSSTYSGVTLNSTQLTTAIGSVTISDCITRCLISNVSGGWDPASSPFSLYLKKGDVIRPHTNGDAPGNAGFCFFNVTYEG